LRIHLFISVLRVSRVYQPFTTPTKAFLKLVIVLYSWKGEAGRVKDFSVTKQEYRNAMQSGGGILSNTVPTALYYPTDKCVIVTAAYLFYIVNGFCAGVRDRKTGRWKPDHGAVGFPISGLVINKTNRLMRYPAIPRIGDHLWFETTADPIETDVVLGIEALSRIPDELLERTAVIIERSKSNISSLPALTEVIHSI
jgi:hypothetical protein